MEVAEDLSILRINTLPFLSFANSSNGQNKQTYFLISAKKESFLGYRRTFRKIFNVKYISFNNQNESNMVKGAKYKTSRNQLIKTQLNTITNSCYCCYFWLFCCIIFLLKYFVAKIRATAARDVIKFVRAFIV